MSIYSWIVGTKTKQIIWIGKTVHDEYKPIYYHIGDASKPKSWEDTTLNMVLWKFLADNAGEPILVLMEHEMTDEYFNYQSIGGDQDVDISFEDYLKDWKGK